MLVRLSQVGLGGRGGGRNAWRPVIGREPVERWLRALGWWGETGAERRQRPGERLHRCERYSISALLYSKSIRIA